MHKNQEGSLVIPLVISMLLLLGTGIFAIWAYAGMQDYKKNVDKKINVAVAAAIIDEDTKKDAELADKEKQPLNTYTAPEAFGSVSVKYPKTWSVYSAENVNLSLPVDAYFNPVFVPYIQGNGPFALRIQVISNQYAKEIQQFDSLLKSGKVTVTAYRLPKVSGALGVKVEGSVLKSQGQGVMVLLPLRDKTLKIWTEGTQSVNDFNTNILPNLTFVP